MFSMMVSTGVSGILYTHKCTAVVDEDSASLSYNTEDRPIRRFTK